MNEPFTDAESDLLVRALEAAPEIVVPGDFAERLMLRVPQQRQRRYVLRRTVLREARVGRRSALLALGVLLAGMLVLAPHTTGSQIWLLIQGLLFVQMAGLLVWMGVSYRRPL